MIARIKLQESIKNFELRLTAGLKEHWLICVVMLIQMLILAYRMADVWTQGFFFDEMWRVDMITSRDTIGTYMTHDTPIPFGWLIMNKVVSILGQAPEFFRAQSLVFFEVALVLLYKYQISFQGTRKSQAAFIVGIFALQPYLFSIFRDFNQYSYELMILFIMLFLTQKYQHVNTTRNLLFILVCIVVSALTSIAPLFVLPVVFPVLALKAWGKKNHLLSVALCIVVVVTITLSSYYFWYKPVIGNSLISYWNSNLQRSIADLFQELTSMFGDYSRASLLPSENRLIAYETIVFLSLLIGSIVLLKKDKLLLAAIGGMFAVAYIANQLGYWPIDMSERIARVNIVWIGPIFVVALFGIFYFLEKIASEALRLILSLAVVVLLVGNATTVNQLKVDDVVFRGMENDISRIVSLTPANRRVYLVSYHFMTHFYTNYYGLTANHKFQPQILREVPNDRSLYEKLPSIISEKTPKAEIVWLLIPWEAGPDNHRLIESIELPGFTKTHDEHGQRAQLVGFISDEVRLGQ